MIRKLLRAQLLFGVLLCLGASPLPAAAPLSSGMALQYFQEADAITRADRGRLWGVSLGGGLLLVDPETRLAYANQPDPQGRLRRVGPVLRGEIPTDVNLANTALAWAGGKWSMILLPLPEDRVARARLIVHELWHGVQDQLGLPSSAATNHHLDTREGRYWLQLEWRALARALAEPGSKRAAATIDAALFRAQRRALFPGAAVEENAMEMHEGMAEYTGIKLSGATDPARFVIETNLQEAPETESFVRSFAYATGPAYGLLLDETGLVWRKGLQPSSDLGALLLRRANLTLPPDLSAAAARRAVSYDSADLAAREQAREKARRAVLDEYRAKLVDGPVLKLPLHNMKMEFDPGNLVPLESAGTVYPHIRIVDDWGILTVKKQGALLKADFSEASVTPPAKLDTQPFTGDDWTLELKPGWELAPGSRKGDFQLRKTSAP